MMMRTRSDGILLFSVMLFAFGPLVGAQAQDVDVPGNLTMHDSADGTVGNISKEGVPFLHNFGTNNTFLGIGAGNFTMSGDTNTALGFQVLQNNTTGVWNTASGAFALFNNTTGFENTAVGVFALRANTTGFANTACGQGALINNTGGYYNTASGAGALNYNTSGVWNTASGVGALGGNTTGHFNTADGMFALFSNTTGQENTASGIQALEENTTGYRNTASGVRALQSNTTGNFNTAVGWEALIHNISGSYNTALGSGADFALLSSLTNATAIGYAAIVDDSNKIRLGNHDVSVIEGEVPYTYTSDRNKKENLHAVDAEAVLAKLRGLSVTSWNYKGQDAKQFRHYGPVAQDFFAAFGHDAVGTIGTPTTITSGDLDGILMLAAQALEKRTVEQEKEIAQLKARLEALEHQGCQVATKLGAGR
jgi:Chaperone of endosialidase